MPLIESKAKRTVNILEWASTLPMCELFLRGRNTLQTWDSDMTVIDILDPSTSTGSGIYFEDREVPMPSNYTKKRSHPTPLVDGKAMHPPPALYQDSRLVKKRCISPFSNAMTCNEVNHWDQNSVHECLGFREAALALTSLSMDDSARDHKVTASIMPQEPSLKTSLAIPLKAYTQDL